MTKEMSVRPDQPMGQAGQMRPVEAADLERVEGGTRPLDVKHVFGALAKDALVEAGVAVVKTFVNAANAIRGLLS